MRRVVRGHDKPYAIFEPFGGKPDGQWTETEPFLLDNLDKLAEGQRRRAATSTSIPSIFGSISRAI